MLTMDQVTVKLGMMKNGRNKNWAKRLHWGLVGLPEEKMGKKKRTMAGDFNGLSDGIFL